MRIGKSEHRWMLVCLCLAAWVVLWCGVVQGENYVRPRLVEHFDFEEADEGNYEAMPRYWFAIGRTPDINDPHFLTQPVHAQQVERRGFSTHSEVRFDRPQTEVGEHRLYLGLNGGSAGAFLQKGAIPALSHSDYQITVKVKTTKLEHARVHLEAYFIDSRGERIKESTTFVPSFETSGKWVTKDLLLRGIYAEAAWIGIQVELLQPEQQPDLPLMKHDVMFSEVEGGAWIDDVAVWQLPHVSIRSESNVNIIRGKERPMLSFEVRDLSARPMVAQVRVYDHNRQAVAELERPIGSGQPLEWRWRADLPRYGWYMVDMIVREGEQGFIHNKPIARSISALLWLDDIKEQANVIGSAPVYDRFGIHAAGSTVEEIKNLSEVLKATELHWSVISCWESDTTVQTLPERLELFDEFLREMMQVRSDFGFDLTPLPELLADPLDIDINYPFAVMSQPREFWDLFLTPLLMRYGQNVQQWHMGDVEQFADLLNTELPDNTRNIVRQFQSLTTHPKVMFPWRIDYTTKRDMPQPVAYSIEVPTSVLPDTLPQYLSEWDEEWSPSYDLKLSTMPADVYSHEKRISDLVRRMVYCSQMSPGHVTITRPWAVNNWRGQGLSPDPLLGAFATVAQLLNGREYWGEVDFAKGIRCHIFDGERGGMLVLWNESAEEELTELKAYLGKSVVKVDVWGNREVLSPEDGKHRLELTGTPVFVEGADAKLAIFRAGFRVDKPFIESIAKIHKRQILLRNPWMRAISGSLNFVGPEGWQIDPGWLRFTIPAGGEVAIPVEMSFPISEVAGETRLKAKFELDGGFLIPFEADTPMELGLEDVEFHAMLSLEKNRRTGKDDVLVTQLISNKGSDNLTMYAFVNIEGYPRQQRIISNLPGGESIVRRFRFPNAQVALNNRTVRAGLRPVSGGAVMNVILNE